MAYDISSWTVTEVCDWVEEIGLGQYRRRFLHHCIDGSLLLRLTGHELKVSPCATPNNASKQGLSSASRIATPPGPCQYIQPWHFMADSS